MNVPHYEQELDYSCLPACVRMVLAYYGEEKTESQLRALLKTRPGGTSPVQVMLRLPNVGFEASVQMASKSILQGQLAANHPVIVHVWTELLPHWQGGLIHALTVLEYNDSVVMVNDPAFADAPLTIPTDIFLRAWAATDHLTIIIQPLS